MADVTALRQAIMGSLPVETSYFGATPDLTRLYLPPAHVKALRLDCHLVIGTRGVGKSVWTAVLGSTELRKALGASVPELDPAEVRIGFAEPPCIDHYPDADTFAQLLGLGIPAYDIWRSVVARWVAGTLAAAIPCSSWSETVAWIKANPEALARLMQQANERLADDKRGLILFDALDRLSHDWRTMDRIVRDLLRTALWLKSYSRLSAKVFLREDQFERTVTDFPDASKLLATRAELTWALHDLHGLLWQTLINAPNKQQGERLRELYRSVVKALPVESKGVWQLPGEVKKATPTQRALFEALAGPWMGRDRRRGVPYIWSVGHLADGKGRTSPRSFLAAIRQAAEDSLERYPDHPHALHYESIKRGIQKASEIRVNEMAEDYPWVRTFMSPLTGLTVPCEYALIEQRWVHNFPDGPGAETVKRLPPQHAERGWDGLRQDLIRLGIFETKKDGRIDMPDLYRVGFGLGRRGGVKPKGLTVVNS